MTTPSPPIRLRILIMSIHGRGQNGYLTTFSCINDWQINYNYAIKKIYNNMLKKETTVI